MKYSPEERISELEFRTTEILEYEKQENKRMRKSEQNLVGPTYALWEPYKKRKGNRKYFLKHNLDPKFPTYDEKYPRILRKINKERPRARYIIIKLGKAKDKGRILKAKGKK